MRHLSVLVILMTFLTLLISSDVEKYIHTFVFQNLFSIKNITIFVVSICIFVHFLCYMDVQKKFYQRILFNIMYKNEMDGMKEVQKYDNDLFSENYFGIFISYLTLKINKRKLAEKAFRYRFKKDYIEMMLN